MHNKICLFFWNFLKNLTSWDLFRTHQNTWDGTFCKTILANLSILDACKSPGHDSEIILFSLSLLTRKVYSPANIYPFKVNNKNTTKKCQICSKLTIKIPDQRQRRRSGVFIVNFEYISHLFWVFLLLTSSR